MAGEAPKFKALPSQQRLLELFDYNPVTGVVVRRVKRNKANSGDIVGTKYKGYLRVCVDGVRYRLHRLIWVMVTGREPDPEVDHRDSIGTNNRWDNLRESNRSGNCANKRSMRAIALKGAYRRSNGRFASKVVKDYRVHHLGTFDTEAAAHAAYVRKATELFGEFARSA